MNITKCIDSWIFFWIVSNQSLDWYTVGIILHLFVYFAYIQIWQTIIFILSLAHTQFINENMIQPKLDLLDIYD